MTTWDRLAETKGPMRAAWDEPDDDTDRHVAIVTEAVPGVDTGLILDFGCGPGRLTGPMAARHPNHHFVGVDTSPGMIDPESDVWTGPNLLAWVGDIRTISTAVTFDGAYSMLTFQHMSHGSVISAVRAIAYRLRHDTRMVAQFTIGDETDIGPLSHPWRSGDVIADTIRPMFPAGVSWRHDPIQPSWCWVTGYR